MEEQIKNVERFETMVNEFINNSEKTIKDILNNREDKKLEFKKTFVPNHSKERFLEYVNILEDNYGKIYLKSLSYPSYYDNYENLDSLDKLRLFKHILREI